MMIFRKGEVVQVIETFNHGVEKYIGRVGKVEKVGNLEQDEHPFIVIFYSGSRQEVGAFSHTELRLANGSEDAEKRQRHYNEARLFRMQRKI